MTQRRIRSNYRPIRPLAPPKGWDDLRPLIEARLRLGLTQGELAGAMSVAQSRVSMLERGRVPVTAASLRRYRDALLRCAKHIRHADELLADAADATGDDTPRQITLAEVDTVIAELAREVAA